jgi:peptide/nickel transport system permease protein
MIQKELTNDVNWLRSTLFATNQSKAGVALILISLSVIVGGIVFSHYSPYDTTLPNQPPSLTYPLGTDFEGHDLWTQVAWGAFPSLTVALISSLGIALVGFFLGVTGGYFQRSGSIIAGLSDTVMSLPHLPLLIVIGSLFVVSDQLIVASLILIFWPLVCRTLRNQVQTIKTLPFVDSARMSGLSDWQIIWRVIVPQVSSLAVAYFIINLSLGIVIVTTLEFLGVAGSPLTVSWGSILYWAQQFGFFAGDWWWVIMPGTIISITISGFALVGLSIERIANPRLRL